MRTFYCDHFVLPLPEGHRFPMSKYALLRERVAADPRIRLEVPPPAVDAELALAHEPAYIASVVEGTLDRQAVRRMGFPWSPSLVERSRRSVGGTIAAVRAALDEGWAANLAGGTHHAFADRGEGFCVFNDAAVATLVALGQGQAAAVAIVDLDVHQGNGTASLFRNDPRVFSLSVHGAGNYPFRKETSDLDIALADGADDDAYLEAVERGLDGAAAHEPDLVLYVAGADPYGGDALGRLGVTREGLAARDRLVFDRFERSGTPLATVMAGGYARPIEHTVDIHAHTVLEAASRWQKRHGRASERAALSFGA